MICEYYIHKTDLADLSSFIFFFFFWGGGGEFAMGFSLDLITMTVSQFSMTISLLKFSIYDILWKRSDYLS